MACHRVGIESREVGGIVGAAMARQATTNGEPADRQYDAQDHDTENDNKNKPTTEPSFLLHRHPSSARRLACSIRIHPHRGTGRQSTYYTQPGLPDTRPSADSGGSGGAPGIGIVTDGLKCRFVGACRGAETMETARCCVVDGRFVIRLLNRHRVPACVA